MEIRDLQTGVNERWNRQLGNPCHESADAEHALIHMIKAMGKVASALNDAQHEHRDVRADEVAKYLADVVICAARFAGCSMLDLNEACEARLTEKFPL
jgi:hypothetical protein